MHLMFFVDDILWIVQNLAGDFQMWPHGVQEALLSQTWHHKERGRVLPFLYVNGIRDADSVIRFLLAIKGDLVRRDSRKIRAMLQSWQQEGERGRRIRSRYYAFSTSRGMYEDLNGRPRSHRRDL